MEKEKKHNVSISDTEKELRVVSTGAIEHRSGDEGNSGDIIEGIAAVVEQRTSLGYYDEVIERGAFNEALNDDVVALFNHDFNQILGRTSNDTLSLSLSEEGHLRYSIKLDERSYSQDLLKAIKRGDVTQSSFAFTVSDAEWQVRDGVDVRVIKKVARLYDVSPVTIPAYSTTSVSARSVEELKENKESIEDSEKRKVQIQSLIRKKSLL